MRLVVDERSIESRLIIIIDARSTERQAIEGKERKGEEKENRKRDVV